MTRKIKYLLDVGGAKAVSKAKDCKIIFLLIPCSISLFMILCYSLFYDFLYKVIKNF